MTVTRAVRDHASASSVMLWEPTAAGEELVVTASTGAALRGMTASLAIQSGLGTAFHTGDFAFAADVITDPRVKFRWHELTSARSGAWLPVVRDGRSVAVIALSWNTPRGELSEREEGLLQLLAAEAAITIERTDLLVQLQASARTDALTGLPNRRVWDEDFERELARARRHGGDLCLAMLDLDRFKAFNDRHGHRPATICWPRRPRPGAPRCGPRTRSRATAARSSRCCCRTPTWRARWSSSSASWRSCRSGRPRPPAWPVWDGAENATQLLARADAALYEAKGAGRNRALLAR